MSTTGWVVIGAIVAIVVWLISVYNGLVAMGQRVSQAFADIDVQLRQRHDLIPNLVETVKGYARHERDLFERVARLRSQAGAVADDTRERLDAERDLAGAVGRLLAVAEAYPALRASENFLQLQHALTQTEDRIQASRRFYNGNVRDYNNRVQQVPSNLVARAFGFEAHLYFELPSLAERAAPAVKI
jgi:LemA protein